KYADTAPKLAAWLEANVPEALTVLELPAAHRRKLRTTNMLERINKGIKRRTRVATLFPNEQSALRLVTAVLVEISEEWDQQKLSQHGNRLIPNPILSLTIYRRDVALSFTLSRIGPSQFSAVQH